MGDNQLEPAAWLIEGLDGKEAVYRKKRFDRIAKASDWKPCFAAEDIIQLIEDIRDERTLPENFDSNKGAQSWNAAVNKVLDRVKSEFEDKRSKTNG